MHRPGQVSTGERMFVPESPDGRHPTLDHTLLTTRVIVSALVVGVLAFAAITPFLPRLGSGAGRMLALPVALAGLVGFVVGYRLYGVIRERAPRNVGPAVRAAALQRATIVSLAVTEATAMSGLVVYLLTDDPLAWIGVATHVLLTGAVWPSRTRFDDFIAEAASPPDAG